MITIPPPRDRRSDIPLLAGHFLGAACARRGVTVPHLTPGAMAALLTYAYPGNVRELITPWSMVWPWRGEATSASTSSPTPFRATVAAQTVDDGAGGPLSLAEAVRRFEQTYIQRVPAQSGGEEVPGRPGPSASRARACGRS